MIIPFITLENRSHYPRFRDRLTLLSKAKYLAWRFKLKRDFSGEFLNGLKIHIPGKAARYWDVAFEVFHREGYATPLEEDSVRKVIDLGANVGYASLLFAQAFPRAHILAFEPVPYHCRQFHQHMKENRFAGRVKLVEAAAGNCACSLTIYEADVGSSLTAEAPGSRRLEVPMVDIFETAGSDPVDVLKVDIEGAEYDILGDPRFTEWSKTVRYLIMETHEMAPSHKGLAWCVGRLKECGFEVTEVQQQGWLGFLRAERI